MPDLETMPKVSLEKEPKSSAVVDSIKVTDHSKVESPAQPSDVDAQDSAPKTYDSVDAHKGIDLKNINPDRMVDCPVVGKLPVSQAVKLAEIMQRGKEKMAAREAAKDKETSQPTVEIFSKKSKATQKEEIVEKRTAKSAKLPPSKVNSEITAKTAIVEAVASLPENELVVQEQQKSQFNQEMPAEAIQKVTEINESLSKIHVDSPEPIELVQHERIAPVAVRTVEQSMPLPSTSIEQKPSEQQAPYLYVEREKSPESVKPAEVVTQKLKSLFEDVPLVVIQELPARPQISLKEVSAPQILDVKSEEVSEVTPEPGIVRLETPPPTDLDEITELEPVYDGITEEHNVETVSVEVEQAIALDDIIEAADTLPDVVVDLPVKIEASNEVGADEPVTFPVELERRVQQLEPEQLAKVDDLVERTVEILDKVAELSETVDAKAEINVSEEELAEVVADIFTTIGISIEQADVKKIAALLIEKKYTYSSMSNQTATDRGMREIVQIFSSVIGDVEDEIAESIQALLGRLAARSLAA